MNQQATAQRTARLVLISTFANSLWFTLPIWYLYATQQLYLSPAAAINLNILVWIVSLFFNAPTGALADRFGRKKLYLVGAILAIAAPVGFCLKLSLPALAFMTFLSGIGQGVMSGELLPIVHRHYELSGFNRRRYRAFLSSNQAVYYCGRILNGVIGAWLYTLNPLYPYFATIAAMLAGFTIVLFVRDIAPKHPVTETWQHLRATASALVHTPYIRTILLLYIFVDTSGESIWTALQALYHSDGRSATTIGWLFSVVAASSALASYSYRHIIARWHPYSIFQIANVCLLVTALLLWQDNITLRLYAVIPSGFIFGATVVALNDAAQHHLPNRYHSTALSILASLKIMTFATGSLIIGFVINHWGTHSARTVLFASALIVIVTGSLIWRCPIDQSALD
ncbi:MAG: MFS transporter [Candidatus Saccharimonadales bacterium]|nr:MFS transporter [Candidatus Saccharibacteria bacterium]